jgi:hypothetical protein
LKTSEDSAAQKDSERQALAKEKEELKSNTADHAIYI